jgi:hypothetical protein
VELANLKAVLQQLDKFLKERQQAATGEFNDSSVVLSSIQTCHSHITSTKTILDQ